MKILWLVDIPHEYGLRHGATLRYVNFSRGLVARNHAVYYLVTKGPQGDRAGRNEFLEALKEENCISGFFEIEKYSYSALRGKLSRLAIHPCIQNWVLRSALAPYKNQIYKLISRLSADVCIISQRSYLPLLPDLAHATATMIDWCDSFLLANIREIHLLLKTGRLTKLPAATRALITPLMEETFYSKYSAANIMVSKADKKCMDRLNDRPQLNHVIHNGVAFPVDGTREVTKEPNRLIFSGSMSFPPNYNGALWFIERVMPLLVQKNRNSQLVIAGQEPIPELLNKADEHIKVTGLVPDIRAEIAKSQLYVAPLISGTGFRNKIVEAIASGTYVIGTPMALDFLDSKLRRALLVARTPEEFAAGIQEFLQNPRAFDDRLHDAMKIVREDYQWASRVKELEDLCRQAMEQRAQPRR